MGDSGEFEERVRREVGDRRCTETAPGVPVYGFDDEEESKRRKVDAMLGIMRVLRQRIPIQYRLAKLKIVKNCFTGSEMVRPLFITLTVAGRRPSSSEEKAKQSHHLRLSPFQPPESQTQFAMAFYVINVLLAPDLGGVARGHASSPCICGVAGQIPSSEILSPASPPSASPPSCFQRSRFPFDYREVLTEAGIYSISDDLLRHRIMMPMMTRVPGEVRKCHFA